MRGVLVLALALCASSATASTWYIRTDGGTPTQCTGLTDAPYPGTGTGQPCAFSKFQYATGVANVGAKMQGGDTVIVGSGEHRVGYDPASVFAGCSSAYPYDCVAKDIPGGPSPDNPTRILGAGWESGCQGVKPQLWGGERAKYVMQLGGSNIDLQCLDITDHSACIEFGPSDTVDGSVVKCSRSSYPYGPWAGTGISSVAGTTGVKISNVDVHGLAHTGIFGYRNGDWTLTNTRIAANGWVGWDSDGTGDDSYTGTTTFDRVKVEWNGCGEKYPLTTNDLSSPADKHHCWSQSQGGFGDGIGLGDGATGDWVIADSSVSWNTSDGIDLLHGGGSTGTVKIFRSKAEGNAGQAVKTKAHQTYMENSIIIGNCGFHKGQPFTSTLSNTGTAVGFDTCRANGDTIAFANGVAGQQFHIRNSTILSNGDSAIVSSGSNCDSATAFTLYNSIIYGGRQFLDDTGINPAGGNDTVGFYYASGSDGNGGGTCGGLTLDHDYNTLYRLKTGTYSLAPHETYASPNFTGTVKQGPYASEGYFSATDYAGQLHLAAANGAADESVSMAGTSDDYNRYARGEAWDTGAYEYGTSAPVTPPLTASLSPLLAFPRVASGGTFAPKAAKYWKDGAWHYGLYRMAGGGEWYDFLAQDGGKFVTENGDRLRLAP